VKVLYFLRDNGGCGFIVLPNRSRRALHDKSFEVRHVEKGDNEEQSRNTFFGRYLRDAAFLMRNFATESGNSKNSVRKLSSIGRQFISSEPIVSAP